MKRLFKATSYLVLTAIVVAGVGYAYFKTYSPHRERFPVRGVDVSHHQGQIDWQQVATDDVAFAILKASEGGDHVDEEFQRNLAGARAAGLAVGAYHFFTLCRPGDEQAANFLSQVPRDIALLPPVLDLEYEGNCSARPAPEALRAEVEKFLSIVEAAFEREVVFYTTYGFARDYLDDLPKRPAWVRWIVWEPPHADWILWQYYDQGRVAGIEGDVDLNVLQGDAETLKSLVLQP